MTNEEKIEKLTEAVSELINAFYELTLEANWDNEDCEKCYTIDRGGCDGLWRAQKILENINRNEKEENVSK